MATFVGVLIFLFIALVGLMVYAYMRKEHEAERYRLTKHQQKLMEKEPQGPDESIFLVQQKDYLGKILAQAGMEARYQEMRGQWIGWGVGGAVVVGIGAFTAIGPEFAIIGGVFGAAVGGAAFIKYLQVQADQRQKRMTEQLPGVLETMVSSLKSGSPVVEVFKVLSDTAPEPIRHEFKRALVSLQLGKPFRDVLNEMTARIRTPDFRLLTQAIFISQDVGGNLSEVVSTIAEAIRARFKLRDQMNAMTAQGRMTSYFVGCLPFFITGALYAMSPGYLIPFFNNPVARVVSIFMLFWELIGFWILLKMTTFEV